MTACVLTCPNYVTEKVTKLCIPCQIMEHSPHVSANHCTQTTFSVFSHEKATIIGNDLERNKQCRAYFGKIVPCPQIIFTFILVLWIYFNFSNFQAKVTSYGSEGKTNNYGFVITENMTHGTICQFVLRNLNPSEFFHILLWIKYQQVEITW